MLIFLFQYSLVQFPPCSKSLNAATFPTLLLGVWNEFGNQTTLDWYFSILILPFFSLAMLFPFFIFFFQIVIVSFLNGLIERLSSYCCDISHPILE